MNILFFLVLLVVLLVIAGWVIGGVLTLLWWALVGLLIGAAARLLVRGTTGLGMLRTILSGVAGAIGGGIIANALDLGGLLELLVAVLVAAVVVSLFARDRPG